jgi:hypothetical protein
MALKEVRFKHLILFSIVLHVTSAQTWFVRHNSPGLNSWNSHGMAIFDCNNDGYADIAKTRDFESDFVLSVNQVSLIRYTRFSNINF